MEIKLNKLPGLAARAHQALSRALADTAKTVRDEAQAGTNRVDTGAMEAGWFTVATNADTYEAAVSAAAELNPNAQIMEKPFLEGDSEAWIGNVVDYAIFNEMGTVRMAADPMLIPAMETVKDTFPAAVGRAIGQAAG